MIKRKGCHRCHVALKVINSINRYLPDDKQILIFDNTEWEEYRLLTHPIVRYIDPKDFQQYPYINIDGIHVPSTTVEIALYGLIANLVSRDLTRPILYKGYEITKDNLAPLSQE